MAELYFTKWIRSRDTLQNVLILNTCFVQWFLEVFRGAFTSLVYDSFGLL